MRALLLSLILLLFPPPVLAKYDPLSVPNNKLGIHIVDVNDMADAATLVNSSGGDWGYVTLVIQEDDRNVDKWQNVFNQMRRLHLIPIVRLATHVDQSAWVIPSHDSASDWARFLNSLNWPTENRYIIVFNEPNHANEWGKRLDPENYADTLKLFTDTLHGSSADFFVMPAALDDSAASDGSSMEAGQYLSREIAHQSGLFDSIDGWASHAYPNPGFSGSPFAVGRGTLYSYQWEMGLLRQLGVNKLLPIFITETGWIHSEGVTTNFGLLSSDEVGNDLKVAAATTWQDESIAAVTPFVLNYQAYPFDHFSWKRFGSSDYYPQFSIYQSIPKVSGEPKQREQFTFAQRFMPVTLVAGSTYTMSSTLTNIGQSILTEQDGFTLKFTSNGTFTTLYDPLPILEPKQSGTITVHLETPDIAGVYSYKLAFMHNDREVIIESGTVQIVPPPSISVSLQLGWRSVNDVSNATVLVYAGNTLLHKVNGVKFVNGLATVTGLRNIVPNQKYRVVVLAPYYLPRQKITTLNAQMTQVTVPRMLPLDFNRDGTLTPADLLTLIQLKPNFILSLFVGP